MGDKGLSTLQRRVLGLLAGIEPPWTLTGGGALVGVHLHHRTTRDLDLLFHGRDHLGPASAECVKRLTAAGLEVETIQREPAFQRLLVSEGRERVVLDLVAEPVPSTEAPLRVELGGTEILADSMHEILVNKLCALLGRSELRDLWDVQALLGAGGDLERALRAAPSKGGAFSPITLAWVLRGMPLENMGGAAGPKDADHEGLQRFREVLVDRLVRAARPEEE